MKSLFYKDMKNLKQQGKQLFLILALWIGISIQQRQIEFLGGMLAVYSAIFPISALAYDEKAGWDKYALVLSYTRKQMVLSKYLLAVTTLFVSMLLTAAVGVFTKTSPYEMFWMTGIFLAIGLIAIDLVLPCMFRLGVERGRIVMMMIFMIPCLIVVLGGKMLSGISLDLEVTVCTVLAVCLVLLPVSAAVSIRIYEAKEF